MTNLILIFVLIFVLLYYYHRPFSGIITYLAIVFYAPYLSFGSIDFRIELIMPLCFLLILISKNRRLYFPRLLYLWMLIVLFLTCITLLSYDYDSNSSIGWVTLFNFFRYGILILVASNINIKYDDLRKFLVCFVIFSFPIALISIGQAIKFEFALDITEKFYSSLNRPVFQGMITATNLSEGYIFRTIGVFENVSYYASYLLIVLLLSFEILLQSVKYSLSFFMRLFITLILILNISAGVLCSSTTFYVGFSFIIVYLVLRYFSIFIKYYVLIGTSFLAFLIYIRSLYWDKFSIYLANLEYIYNSLFNGQKLTQRYNLHARQEGDLTDVIFNHLFFGSGFHYRKGLAVNDSLYIELFYSLGIIGSILLLFFFVLLMRIIIQSHKDNRYLFIMIFFLLFLSGIGCNTLSIIRFSEWIWLLIGFLLVRYRYVI